MVTCRCNGVIYIHIVEKAASLINLLKGGKVIEGWPYSATYAFALTPCANMMGQYLPTDAQYAVHVLV